jgi:hypothetical protein
VSARALRKQYRLDQSLAIRATGFALFVRSAGMSNTDSKKEALAATSLSMNNSNAEEELLPML